MEIIPSIKARTVRYTLILLDGLSVVSLIFIYLFAYNIKLSSGVCLLIIMGINFSVALIGTIFEWPAPVFSTCAGKLIIVLWFLKLKLNNSLDIFMPYLCVNLILSVIFSYMLWKKEECSRARRLAGQNFQQLRPNSVPSAPLTVNLAYHSNSWINSPSSIVIPNAPPTIISNEASDLPPPYDMYRPPQYEDAIKATNVQIFV